MSKIKTVFKTDTFKDFAGMEREVTFCAVSNPISGEYYTEYAPYYEHSIKKEVLLGVSVQNPMDKANTELGRIIAKGKAMKSKSRIGVIAVTNSGMINTRVIQALLDQEMQYFKQNPGKYLKGYDKDKELFLTTPSIYNIKYNID